MDVNTKAEDVKNFLLRNSMPISVISCEIVHTSQNSPQDQLPLM